MAATASPLRIVPPKAAPLVRPRKGRKVVTLHLQLADIENRKWSDEQLGRVVRAIVLAKAYGSVSPAMLAMRMGITPEAAQQLLGHLVTSGSLPAETVTGSTL